MLLSTLKSQEGKNPPKKPQTTASTWYLQILPRQEEIQRHGWGLLSGRAITTERREYNFHKIKYIQHSTHWSIFLILAGHLSQVWLEGECYKRWVTRLRQERILCNPLHYIFMALFICLQLKYFSKQNMPGGHLVFNFRLNKIIPSKIFQVKCFKSMVKYLSEFTEYFKKWKLSKFLKILPKKSQFYLDFEIFPRLVSWITSQF